MNWTSVARGTLIGVTAIFVARCGFFSINPLIVGFFVAVCLAGENTFFTYIGGLLGLIWAGNPVDVVRYGIVMLIIAALLNARQLLLTKGRELFVAAVVGVLLAVVTLTFRVLGLVDMSNVLMVSEGFIAFSTCIVYLYAINVLKKDYGRIATENEAIISCLVLGATVLLGMPRIVFGEIVLLEALSIFGMLIFLYKFGFGIGMCWCMMTGFVASFSIGITEYFVGWILVGVLAQGLSCTFGGGRFAFGMYYGGVYLLVGTYLYETILSEEGFKALASALLVFLLAPRRLMLRIEEGVKTGALSDNSPEWGRLVIDRINNLSRAFKRIEYTLASDSGSSMSFSDVGNIIEGFTNQLERAVPMRKTISSAIISNLALRDIRVKNLVMLKNQEERYEIYITAKVVRGKLVLASMVRDIVSKEIGMDMEVKDESRNIVGRNYEMICLRQKPTFNCNVAVRRLSRYESQVSGDDYYVGDIMDGQKLIMLADGMGNGVEAASDSGMLIDVIEELLTAGFDKETSIKIVNTYLSERNKGERFSTLDMLILDMHTGYGRLFKQGAATTFVKRGQWIELIKSTSLPMGVIDGAVCENCRKKFYHNDIIVMVSDGVLESIVVENSDDYLRDLLLNSDNQDVEEIATEIADAIGSISGNRLRDDASIIVVRLSKR